MKTSTALRTIKNFIANLLKTGCQVAGQHDVDAFENFCLPANGNTSDEHACVLFACCLFGVDKLEISSLCILEHSFEFW
jgi:hypothetical protein